MTPHLSLTRQFALFSFTGILLIALLSGFVISRFLTNKLLYREATLTREFVDSTVIADQAWKHFRSGRISPAFERFLHRIATMPDVIRVEAYDTDGTILWATHTTLVGRHSEGNPELARALQGHLVYEHGIAGAPGKEEHRHMDEVRQGLHFVETYIPVWNAEHNEVVGAVEIYKQPRVLHDAIVEGQRLVWGIALLGALVLFLSLFEIFKRASRIMAEQHARLTETETLGMIGETASAVAHAMRNPLASIRASAELTLSDDLAGAQESAHDIIDETDRLDHWARELLEFSHIDDNGTGLRRVDISALLRGVISDHQPMLDQANISIDARLDDQDLWVDANATPLRQVFGNLIVNAIEAMSPGGRLTITARRTGGRSTRKAGVEVRLSDTGPGLSDKAAARLFKPFATTKPNGTGLGLPLARRLVARYHGSLNIDSVAGRGLTAIVRLPCATGRPS